jgi:type III pantothenate kinase
MFLDIGNTNVSFIFQESFTIPTKDFTQNIENLIKNASEIIFASVVPSVSEKIKIEAQRQNIPCKEAKIQDVSMKINLENTNEIGIDRAINAYMGWKKHGRNVIIIDFGTALTFDIVKNGEYEGGMIFAGIEMAMHNLHTRTAKLPDVKIRQFEANIGKNTVDAMKFGACIGYLGTLRETISFIENHYNLPFKIVFTGGSSLIFQSHFGGSTFEKNLILEFLPTLAKKT